MVRVSALVFVLCLGAMWAAESSAREPTCPAGTSPAGRIRSPTDSVVHVGRAGQDVRQTSLQRLCSEDRVFADNTRVEMDIWGLGLVSVEPGRAFEIPTRVQLFVRSALPGFLDNYLSRGPTSDAFSASTLGGSNASFAIDGLERGEAVIELTRSIVIPVLSDPGDGTTISLIRPSGRLWRTASATGELTMARFDHMPRDLGVWKVEVASRSGTLHGRFEVVRAVQDLAPKEVLAAIAELRPNQRSLALACFDAKRFSLQALQGQANPNKAMALAGVLSQWTELDTSATLCGG